MADSARLTWFELQVCPAEFRLAAVPGQPLLIGFGGEDGATALVDPHEASIIHGRMMAAIDGIVREARLFSTPMRRAGEAFEDDEAMEAPSIHLRVAYGEDRRWSSIYPLGAVPPNVASLVEQCQALAREVLDSEESHEIPPEEALARVQPPPSVVARILIRRSGGMLLDGRPAGMDDLARTLDRLREQEGGVIYSREDPESEAPDGAMAALQAVIDAGLPVMLHEPGTPEEEGQWMFPPSGPTE